MEVNLLYIENVSNVKSILIIVKTCLKNKEKEEKKRATWKKGVVSGSSADITSLKLSSVVNASTDTDKFLVLDSSGNVDFRTGAQVLSDIGAGTGDGDITAVVAGTGLSGGATAGSATLNVSGLTVSELAAGSLQTRRE